MKLSSSLVFVLYWAVLCIDCVFLFNRMDEYRHYSKPLIMPVLYILMALETVDTSHKRSKLIVSLLLLFSFGGDILLLNNKERSFFTFGLLCFLVVHILYALFFFRIKHFAVKNAGAIGLALVVVAVYQYFLLSATWAKIKENDLAVQVIVYSLSLSLMFIGAVNASTGKRAKKVAWKYFVPGAILFVLSDSLIAILKFYPFEKPPIDLPAYIGCAVMLTYGGAQVLLVLGAVKFIKN